MPVSYVFVQDVIVITFVGVVTDKELLEAQTTLFADPLFVGDSPRLVDASQVTEMRLSERLIRHVAQAAYDRGLRRSALVASDKSVVFGLMRMYAQYAGHATVEVFREAPAAIEWLRVDPAALYRTTP